MWAIHKNTLNEFKHSLLSQTFLETMQLPLKHQFYKFGNILFFLRLKVIISNLVIFLPIFNFTLITRHNIMACNLESHAIATKVVLACDNHMCHVFRPAILSKACKPDNFESYNSLKLNFTNIWGLRLSFVDCKSFLESNSLDILALCETNRDDSIHSGNFSVRGYLPFIWKDSCTHMHGLAVYVKEGLPFAWDLSLENSADSYLCFQLALLHLVSYFFFLYQSPSWSLCTVFDTISFNMDEVLLINPYANAFVFGDFNHHLAYLFWWNW